MPVYDSGFLDNRGDDWLKRREEREKAEAEEREKEAKKWREKREAETREEKRLRALIHVEEYFDPDTGKVQEKILVFPKELKPNFSDLLTFFSYDKVMYLREELCKELCIERIRTEEQQYIMLHMGVEKQNRIDGLESKVSLEQLTLQDRLIEACKQGNAKAVGALLKRGAKPDIANAKGEQPLGAAVWGMCPDVVNALLKREGRGGFFAPMTWRECEEHNLRHYKAVFIVPEFAPKNDYDYNAWYRLFLDMRRNSFVRASHLKKADKQWHDNDTSSWVNLLMYVSNYVVVVPELRLGSGLFRSRPTQEIEKERKETIEKEKKRKKESGKVHAATEQEFINYRTQIKKSIESSKQPRIERISHEQKLAAAEEEKQKTLKEKLEITSNVITIEEKKSQQAEQALLQTQQSVKNRTEKRKNYKNTGVDQTTNFEIDQPRNNITKLSILEYPEERKNTTIFCEDITPKLAINKESRSEVKKSLTETKYTASSRTTSTESILVDNTKEIHDHLYRKSLASVKKKKDILNQLQNGLDELSKIELDVEDKYPNIDNIPVKETLRILQNHQKQLVEINQNLHKMASKQQRAQTVYSSSDLRILSGPQKEKIKLLKQILKLNLSDYFITNIAIAKELANPILSKKTRISAGGLGFIAGKVPIPSLIGSLIGIAVPFIGPLISVAVSEGIKYAVTSQEIKEAQKWCFGITTVEQAAAFAENVAERLMFRYQLVVTRLDPLAVEVFAECLVKRAFLYLKSLNSIPSEWVDIAGYAVMGAGILQAAEDSQIKSTDDNDVLLIHDKGEKRYITVNQICQSSPMLTWKSESSTTKYYKVRAQIQTENKMEIVLPHCCVSQFEMKHRQLETGKLWDEQLPISIDLSLQSDSRLECEQWKARANQWEVEANQWRKKANELESTAVSSSKSHSPTKGIGLFDNPGIRDSLNEPLQLQNKLD